MTARRVGNDLTLGGGPAPDLSGRSVLVAEDNVILSAHVCLALERAGARVIGPFPFAGEAMRALGRERPDAAVLDYELGDTDCLGLAQALGSEGVPFALFTSTEPSDRDETGDAPVLAKPTTDEALLAVVGGLLNARPS
jgi:DNA-binding response OmpR family regulator